MIFSPVKGERAVDCLLKGGVIGYPTEAVYGLGCTADQPDAIEQVIYAKRRDARKGLIVVVSALEQVKQVVSPRQYAQIIQHPPRHWPGPFTYILDASPNCSRQLTGGRSTIAVRWSKHPVVRYLCDRVGPIVSTSANISGRDACRTFHDTHRYFSSYIDFILPGPVNKLASPSTIIDYKTGQTIRPG